MNLTPKQIQAIRIAVAEVDGWSDIKENVISIAQDSHSSHKGELTGSHPMNMSWRPMVPNYPESLDAVQAAEMAWLASLPSNYLKSEEAHLIELNLIAVIPSPTFTHLATALQRCIALLMRLAPDKWLEIQNLKD